MSEWLILLAALVMGTLLGVLFFGGLWWTVRKSLASRSPALWIFSSLLLRMGITLAGFYWVGGGHWQRLLLCLFGFLAARLLISFRLRSGHAVGAPFSRQNQTPLPQDSRHAP
jgi:F1F0 ATPase subunit 2